MWLIPRRTKGLVDYVGMGLIESNLSTYIALSYGNDLVVEAKGGAVGIVIQNLFPKNLEAAELPRTTARQITAIQSHYYRPSQ